MVGRLLLKHHNMSIAFLVVLMTVIGITFGIKTYGVNYLEHNGEIVMITLSFINTGLLLATVALLIRLGHK